MERERERLTRRFRNQFMPFTFVLHDKFFVLIHSFGRSQKRKILSVLFGCFSSSENEIEKLDRPLHFCLCWIHAFIVLFHAQTRVICVTLSLGSHHSSNLVSTLLSYRSLWCSKSIYQCTFIVSVCICVCQNDNIQTQARARDIYWNHCDR